MAYYVFTRCEPDKLEIQYGTDDVSAAPDTIDLVTNEIGPYAPILPVQPDPPPVRMPRLRPQYQRRTGFTFTLESPATTDASTEGECTTKCFADVCDVWSFDSVKNTCTTSYFDKTGPTDGAFSLKMTDTGDYHRIPSASTSPLFDGTKTSNYDEKTCQDDCTADSKCDGYSFVPSKGTCTLKNMTPADAKTVMGVWITGNAYTT